VGTFRAPGRIRTHLYTLLYGDDTPRHDDRETAMAADELGLASGAPGAFLRDDEDYEPKSEVLVPIPDEKIRPHFQSRRSYRTPGPRRHLRDLPRHGRRLPRRREPSRRSRRSTARARAPGRPDDPDLDQDLRCPRCGRLVAVLRGIPPRVAYEAAACLAFEERAA
jgi:hypothetical protein